MTEFFLSVDVSLFYFINHTITNPFLDWLMPFLTDLNKNKIVLSIISVWALFVVWKGGNKGRTAIGLLIVTVIISDQLNSSIIKQFFGRIRPCRALEGVRMLVDCGGGLSFPSSHATNNFAAATILSHFYRSQKWYWISFATIVALSRPYVGVHYPSDIVGGAILGIVIGILVSTGWEQLLGIVKKIHLSQTGNLL
ncbi:MAG: phosphatase PAP2 family protein [Bacteroidota bacterium]